MRFIYKFFHSFFWTIFKVFYRLEVKGLENLPDGAAVIAPNHTSYFDPPIVGVSIPEEVHFVAKGELFSHSFLKKLIEKLNAYPVTGKSNDLVTFKLMNKILKNDQKVVIFPEGERTLDGEIGHIQTGIAVLALRSQAPIVPVYLKGVYEVWPRGQWCPWPWGKFICEFGLPIEVSRFSECNKKEAQSLIKSQLKGSLISLKNQSKKRPLQK